MVGRAAQAAREAQAERVRLVRFVAPGYAAGSSFRTALHLNVTPSLSPKIFAIMFTIFSASSGFPFLFSSIGFAPFCLL